MMHMLSNGLPKHVAEDYASGYMDTDDNVEGAGAGPKTFTAVPSGGLFTQDMITSIPGIPETRRRQDGFNEKTGTFFDKDWVLSEVDRRRILESDPEYRFLSRVAGFCGRPATRFFDATAFNQHAKNMLQRAAIADEMSKTALSDLDHMSSVLKEAKAHSAEAMKTYNRIVGIVTAIRGDAMAIRRAYEIFNNLEELLYPKNSQWLHVDSYLSFYARIQSPSEGVDNVQFSEKLLSALVHLSQDAASVYYRTQPAGVVANFERNARIHNPRLLHLSAFLVFAQHAANSSGALPYVVSRMQKAKVFPDNGEYSKTPGLFADDVKELMSLFPRHSARPVSMKEMTPKMYIHFRCMLLRWYGPRNAAKRIRTESATKTVDASKSDDDDSDETCDDIPHLQRPTKRRAAAPAPAAPALRRRVRIGGDDEVDATDGLFRENAAAGTTLASKQAEIMDTTNPDQYQDFLITILGSMFRYGVGTLFYDMNRIRAILCKDSAAIESATLCSEVADKFASLRKVEPSYDLVEAIGTAEYFFGGVDTRKAGIMPPDALAFDPRNTDAKKTTLNSFIGFTLLVFEHALENASDANAAQVEWHQRLDTNGAPIQNWRDGAPTEAMLRDVLDRRMTRLREYLIIPTDTLNLHVAQRMYAMLQLSGAIHAFAGIVKTYKPLRDAFYQNVDSMSATSIAAIESLVPVYMNGEEEQSVYDGKESPNARNILFERLDTPEKRRRIIEDLDRVTTLLTDESPVSGEDEEPAGLVPKLKRAISKTNSELNKAEKNITERLASRGTDSAEKISGNLKRTLASTYVDSAEWAMSPENSGFIIVSDEYRSAVEQAYDNVQMFCPNLRGVSLDDLKSSPLTQIRFARLAAACVSEIESNNSDVPTLNRVPVDVQMRLGRAARRLCSIIWTGGTNSNTGLIAYGRGNGRAMGGGGGGGGGGAVIPFRPNAITPRNDFVNRRRPVENENAETQTRSLAQRAGDVAMRAAPAALSSLSRNVVQAVTDNPIASAVVSAVVGAAAANGVQRLATSRPNAQPQTAPSQPQSEFLSPSGLRVPT